MTTNEPTPDPETPTPEQPDKSLKEHVKARTTWLRLFFMLVLVVLYGISRIVVGAVVALQFFWVLFTGATNQRLEQLGQALATYTYQVIRYLTFNSEQRPFPFDLDWPTGDVIHGAQDAAFTASGFVSITELAAR